MAVKKKKKKRELVFAFSSADPWSLGKKVSTYIHTVLTGVYSVNCNKSYNQTLCFVSFLILPALLYKCACVSFLTLCV